MFPSDTLLTPFEKSNGTQTATYEECISFYKSLEILSDEVKVTDQGVTGIGKPLHLVIIDKDKNFDVSKTKANGKRILLINNGIHPGEPDGIDASMMFARNLVMDKNLQHLLDHIVFCIIPVYNVAGCLNRSTCSRANQNGPEEYGFRGNELNLDLNRDFIKCDSREAEIFNKIFTAWKPDFLIDTHVSDGADYQYTMTYVATQPDKLNPVLGEYERNFLIPELNKRMKDAGWPMSPYVETRNETPDEGIDGFLDNPRYSTGYAALFNCIGFMSETHMLKPFKDRVQSTYAFIQQLSEIINIDFEKMGELKSTADSLAISQTDFPLQWKQSEKDSSMISFNGFAAAYKISDVTGQQRLYYDETKPYTKDIPYFDQYKSSVQVVAPLAYIIPQQYDNVIHLLQLNGVAMKPIQSDVKIRVVVYYVADYNTNNHAYENHYQHSNTIVSRDTQIIQFYKGDMLVNVNQTCNRYIVETLEPQAPDSYFNWNFFDGILMQKEYFSDYVWEDRADSLLQNNSALMKQFQQTKMSDTLFATDAAAQLEWIYNHSAYHEKSFQRYPVARIEWSLIPKKLNWE